MHNRKEIIESFSRFLDVLDELREKCPWDRKQTNLSLRPNTIEECYELSDALVADDTLNICKELGDVLLHVAFYAKIATEKGQFDMKDVCDRLCDKLIYRHPHVFGDVKAETAGEVCKNWEQLKMIVNPDTKMYKELGGFISIGNVFPDEWSWQGFWRITALLSIMLAVMNLLPIPGLDGGHALFTLWEIITRRKPSDKFLVVVQWIGMGLLFALLFYANGNDILRLFL